MLPFLIMKTAFRDSCIGVNISYICWLHRCVLVIEMSWGPYQTCLILHWIHRGIGFLQMERPFTRCLRAPAPAVIGSHDIWCVGMTRVWQRRNHPYSHRHLSPSPQQKLFTLHVSLFLFCIFFVTFCPLKPLWAPGICAARSREAGGGSRERDRRVSRWWFNDAETNICPSVKII